MGDPSHSSSRYHLPEPRVIDINGVNFTVSWGFLEDENSSDSTHQTEILNRSVVMQQRTFHQNNLLLLDIAVYDFGENIDVNLLNDGTYRTESINGVNGIFKNESVTVSVGLVKNTHTRYYFDYSKDGKIVMIKCDKLDTINQIV